MDSLTIIAAVFGLLMAVGGLIYALKEEIENGEALRLKLILALTGLVIASLLFYLMWETVLFLPENESPVTIMLIIAYAVFIWLVAGLMIGYTLYSFKSLVHDAVFGTWYNLHVLGALLFGLAGGALFFYPAGWLFGQWLPEYGWLSLFAGFGGFYLAFQGFYRLRPQVWQWYLRQKAQRTAKPFILLLRSFRDREGREAPDDFAWVTDQQGNMDLQWKKGRSAISDLTRALSGILPVVSIGPYRFKNDTDLAHAIQLRSADENWFGIFRLLADAAHSIVILPGDTPGLHEEIEAIMSSAWQHKTFLYQPPVMETEFNSNASAARSTYALFCQHMEDKYNLSLPPFREQGFIVSLESLPDQTVAELPESSIFTRYRKLRHTYRQIAPPVQATKSRAFAAVYPRYCAIQHR